MKKTVWCGQEYGQVVTNLSVNTSTMSNSGNPPDRGPGGSSVKNLQLNKLVVTTLSSSIPSTSMHLFNAANSGLATTSGQVASRMQNAVHSVLSNSRQPSATHSAASSSKSVNNLVSSNAVQNHFNDSTEGSSDKWSVESATESSSSTAACSSSSLACRTNVVVNDTTSASSVPTDNLSSRTIRTVEQQRSDLLHEASLSGLNKPSPAQLFKNPDDNPNDLEFRHWEDRKSATLASFTLDWTLNQIGRSKVFKDSVQSSSAESDTPGASSGFKRKAGSAEMHENVKRRRCTSVNDSESVSSYQRTNCQLPCLLSPLVVKKDAKSLRAKATTSTTSTDVTAGSSELSNSLLSEFDPIKILSRYRSQGSTKYSIDLGTKSSSPSKTQASVMNNPIAQDSTAPRISWILSRNNQPPEGASVGSCGLYKSVRRVTDTKLPSKELVIWKSTDPKPNTSARLPRPWALKGVPPRVSHPMFARMDATLPPTFTSVKAKVYPKPRRRPIDPTKFKKVDITKSLRNKDLGVEVFYEDTSHGHMTVTDTQIRLATVVYSRKAVQRSKRFMRSQGGALKAKARSNGDNKLEPISANSVKNSSVAKSFVKSSRTKCGASVEPCFYGDRTWKDYETSFARQQTVQWTNSATIVTKIQENPIVDHAIELIRHKREVQELIELMDEKGIVYGLTPMPKLKSCITRGTLTQNNIPLSGFQAKGILQKRLAILLAHGGFTHVNLQPLCVLTEVLEEFYKKMANRLKQVSEMEMHGGEQEFPDPLERTLVETGMGGARGLQDFYNDRIVGFRKRLEDQCLNLRSQYFVKLQSKVGMARNASGGNISTLSSSSSSTHSSHPISPGNRTLIDMLSGMKAAPKIPTNTWEGEKNSEMQLTQFSPKPAETQEYQLQMTNDSTTSNVTQYQVQMTNESSTSGMTHCQTQSSTSPSLKSLLNMNNPGSIQNVSVTSQRRNPMPSPNTTVSYSRSPFPLPTASSSRARTVTQSYQQFTKGSGLIRGDQTVMNIKSPNVREGGGHESSGYQPISNMVSINLNNNVDLGINSNSVPLVSASSGNLMNSASKAKLKEAISQKNLLRLNFEQIPSNCDSTVLLSSSSPSLSSNNASNKPTPTSSINQTTQLKL